MNISEKIQILRRDKEWSQDELAEKLNVSRQSVSKWESGKALPDSEKILAMANLFDVSTDFLLKDEQEPVFVNDERVNELKEMTDNIVKNINPELSIHDFRVVDGPMHTNLIFDVVIPYGFKEVPNEIIKEISLKISEVNDSYFTVIKAEHSFV